MPLSLILCIFVFNFFDEEEIKEDIEVYFDEIIINPNYDEKDKMLLFPFLNENNVDNIICQRKKGYFKNLNDFKKRTGIVLPDSIFEKYFEFDLKKRRFSILSYWEKNTKIVNRFSFYQQNNFINFLWSKNLGSHEILRFSYIFDRKDFKFIAGDYFINKGCGLLYGFSSFFYNFDKKFPFVPESRYISSSLYNNGLKGVYFFYKYFLFYFSSKEFLADTSRGFITYYSGSDKFREEKTGIGLIFRNKICSISGMFERNHLSKRPDFLNKKEFYQASIDFSLPYKNFLFNLEYLPFDNSFFARFSNFKNGFILYKISEKNYDLHSSYISQTNYARDEKGFSVFSRFSLIFLRTGGYVLIYRKNSESDYLYKTYCWAESKNLNKVSLKIDYKNTLSSYKRKRYGMGFKYRFFNLKFQYLIAESDGDLSCGSLIAGSVKYKFLRFSCGTFNTQDYNSRIYFYNSTFFPYYEFLPLYGQGGIISLDLNLKLRNIKIYAGFYEITGEQRETFIHAGFKFENEKVL